MKISLNENIKKQIEMFMRDDLEVGGFIFGDMKNNEYDIKHITMKKGEKNKIHFDSTECIILTSKHSFLGTWHTHVTYEKPVPSSLDIKAIKKFDDQNIHLIFNLKGEYICLDYMENTY